ncbi:MAG: bifunctional hydroxymethylpyrimidine kinase/phosphomethylpyrimidine kinase [Bryobacteraceae bacterium]
MIPVALTIAGSDPSGGAGIQADLKTFHQFGVYGEAVITLLTVQNTTRVDRVDCIPAELVRAQLAAVLEDIPPRAAKTGALGNREIVEMVAAAAAEFTFPLIVDPVMISKHGQPLISPDAVEAIRELLLPRATLICPNLPEAEELAGIPVRTVEDMRSAARRLCELGAKAALVKGGHLRESAIDVLFDGKELREFMAPHFDTPHTHGTGCTYSAGIAAEFARGSSLESAVARAKNYITQAIRSNPGLGHGSGPINHHAPTGLKAGVR